MQTSSGTRIYLIGFMGVGKSTLGKQLAGELGYHFLDLDKVFEQTYKININHFFDKYDETLFRKLEREILESTFGMEKIVISTGGGTPCFFNSMESMNGAGLTVYLEMNAEGIFERLKKAKRKRPLVADLNDTELMRTIAEKLEHRVSFYRQAKIIYPADGIDVIRLAETIRKFNA